MLDKEIDIWKKLAHPHVLQFYGACAIANPPFAVCAYKANRDALAYLDIYENANRHKLVRMSLAKLDHALIITFTAL